MKALLLTAYNHLSIADQPMPEPGPDDLLIQVAACGICGSDVHGYDGSSGRRIPPIVMGHEAAGIVTSIGTNVRAFQPGDRVTFDSTVYCGTCEYCRRGEVNLCQQRQIVGVSCAEFRRPGAFAEYIAVPARIAYHLPDNFSFPHAAMLEAVSVALHAVAVSRMPEAQTVLVIGAGMIGLLLMQAARAAGASSIYIADIDPTRLALARQLGATAALNASGPALLTEIMRLTHNRGVDLVLEAVGLNDTIASAIDSVRKGGTVTLVGNISANVDLPLQKIVTRQVRLQGSCASAGEYPQAIELIASGAIQVAPLITAIAPLSEGPSWFHRLHAREPNLMKIVLDPRTDPTLPTPEPTV
jgi:L-iditol 2-dehydrogenase